MKKETVASILSDIKQHTEAEWKCKARQKSIGRNFVTITGQGNKKIWLNNFPYTPTSKIRYNILGDAVGTESQNIVDSYTGDGIVCCKNSRMGKILMNNSEGTFTCVTPKGEIEFRIWSHSSYIQPLRNYPIVIRINKNVTRVLDIDRELQIITQKEKEIEQLQEEQERKRKEDEDKKAKQLAEAKRLEAEIKRVKDEEEKKRMEELRRKQKEEQERRRLAAEEEERRIDAEIHKKEEEKLKLLAKYTKALSFIRNQAILQNNPNLDEFQNEIKFSHLHDGTVVVIDGGPGTGKTTTLIQRLKLLIDSNGLIDYRLNEPDCKITDKQIEIVSDEKRNWIFFSPNDLLRQYLRSNMQYEGLEGIEDKTKVWQTYLKNIIRSNYRFAGNHSPFEFRRQNVTIFKKGYHIDIIKSFHEFYLKELKDDLLSITDLDLSLFPSWIEIGQRIFEISSAAKNAEDIKSLLPIYSRLQALKDAYMPSGSVRDLLESYNKDINHAASVYLVKWRADEELFAKLSKLISSWQSSSNTVIEDLDVDDDDDDEVEETVTISKYAFDNALAKPLRSLLRKIALNSIVHNKVKIDGRQAELYSIIKDLIDKDQIQMLGEVAWLRKLITPYLKSFDKILFTKLPAIYKKFRRQVLSERQNGWYLEELEVIVKQFKNKILRQQEMSLLLGFINNIALMLQQYSSRSFEELNHPYIQAYRDCMIPVIGVDEATDYGIIDYYAIASLRDYRVSSITLSGDIMQCMKSDGIIDWKELNNDLIFPKMCVSELLVSYRQSPELMLLADHLYELTMGKPSPYTCSISSKELTPKPIWITSKDEFEKINWIADRIIEVQKAYGQLPSIAIFTKDDAEADKLKVLFDEIEKLEVAGIDIINCTGANANLKDANVVRIFSVNKVKGMEFDVVFFYDIDNIGDTEELINKYLYVALSRASFFIGITSNGTNKEIAAKLDSFFEKNGNWKSILNAYREEIDD